MFSFGDDSSTICALSTPSGVGGIAVIRVSGKDAYQLTRKICRFLPTEPTSHKVYFGTAQDLTSSDPIDELLVTYFAEGKSFTGEETTEISCHGGPVITATLLKRLLEAGCRTAHRGEFTFRAFMNGRLDLVQAEGVLNLIESQSRQAARVALRQLKGKLSSELHIIEDGLTWVLAHLEASIDFSTEDIEVVDYEVLVSRLTALIEHSGRLIKSYKQGRLLAEGLAVALVGHPNVGKSSLLNALLGEDRAIVTARPGTTRDLVEGRLSLEGSPVTIVDTAGLRETDDEVEKIGIERTHTARDQADMIFHLIEAGRSLLPDEIADLKKIPERGGWARHRIIINKSDAGNDAIAKVRRELEAIGLDEAARHTFCVSAMTREGLTAVEDFLLALTKSDASESDAVITQVRHLELLKNIYSCLERALALTSASESPEFVAFELQDAVRAIHELLGKEFNEQVIDRIFKEFCLGK